MIYQIVIAGILVIILINLVLNLRNLRTPDRNARVPQPAPLISVLVPARNEEENIRACLETLQKQDYPNYEILVLDDNSTDTTAAIVNEMASGDDRINLYFGEPLPDDWAGKCFACHQLAQKAKGDWLLFVDSDTTHEPHMLRSVLALAMELKTSLLSGFPRQLATSFPQKVIMPVFYFILLGWLPLWWLHRSKTPKPSMAIGQFFFFSADEYRRIGGHEAVKSRIVEDVWMGIETSKHAGRHIAVDLSGMASCHMYRDIGAMWRGLGKSIYSIAAMAPLGLLAIVLVAYFLYIAPFFWLWNGFFLAPEPLLWRATVVLQICLMFFMRWLVDSRFRGPAISMWFHPIGLMFYLINVIYSWLRFVAGAGVTWKERFYGKESTVE
ncbi:MAG: glycosyltransferase [Dehalococcoidales bacterium]|nr:glycosyltransferase [Dehalococcoidales bacterium]